VIHCYRYVRSTSRYYPLTWFMTLMICLYIVEHDIVILMDILTSIQINLVLVSYQIIDSMFSLTIDGELLE
jgi:hypothetical protein